ncbi:MAG: hypothetical protein JNL95_03785 [Chitinophagales bacterium]|nr:hypothetical protein [Chitinophagales bacterium]
MTKNTLITSLQTIASKEEQTIEKYVAEKALGYCEKHPENFFSDILTYGCASGMVSGLVYYADTHTFFDTYYEEIEALRMEYESSTGCQINLQDVDLKNTLAWFAFEQIAYNLAHKLELGL